MSRFWSVLFDDLDAVCFGAKPTDTRVGQWPPSPEHCYFAINALHRHKDLQPSATWHSAHVGRRADCNVTKLRSFLIEFDDVPLKQQEAVVADARMPHSTCVYSGGKSLHYIIALEQPLATRAEYDSVVRRLHQALPQADRSTKNPSRFSRTPGVRRPDNHVLQEMVSCTDRVPNALFFDWLATLAPETAHTMAAPAGQWISLGISKWTKHFLAFGAEPGNWNQSLFNSSCDLARNGWTEDAIAARVAEITGVLDAADRKTIKSGVNAVRATSARISAAD